MTILTDYPPVALLTCPSWCALPTDGHPEVLDRDGSVFVIHRCTVPTGPGAPRVEIERTTVHAPDGSTTDETVVVLNGDPTTAIPSGALGSLVPALALAAELASGGAR